MQFIKKNLFLILIISVAVFSVFVPGPGVFVKNMEVLPLLTFVAMFLSGLSLNLENITSSITNYKIILFSAFTAFVIFPATAYLLASLFFAGTYDAFVGAMIISTQASTITSAIILTMAASGNVPLAIVITVVNNMLSAFVTPFLLRFFLSMDQPVTFNTLEMILNLVIVLIVPIILAQLFAIFLKKAVLAIQRIKKPVANCIVLLFVLIGASSAASEIRNNLQVLLQTVLFCIILHVLILIVCALYARVIRTPKENLPPLLFCSSEKTMTSSTLIWGTYFSHHLIAPIVIVMYHLIQILIDSFLASILARKHPADPGLETRTSGHHGPTDQPRMN